MATIKEIATVKVDGRNLSMAGLLIAMATSSKGIKIAVDSVGGYIGEKNPKGKLRLI
jgi:hypothetical protein